MRIQQRILSTTCIVTLACMAGGATGQNGPAPTAGQPTIKTVVYKEANGIKRAMEMYNREALEKVGSMTEVKQQAMDIYFPPNWNPEKKVPGLLMFHGGGWSGGSRHQLRNVCDYFARRGLVAITADYAMHTGESNQLLPRNISRKRICVTDAKSAIRWVKTHADELGIDPDRLITGGVSAGGHIAVLAHLNSEGLNDPTDLGKIGTDAVAHMLISAAFFVPGRDRDDEVDAFAHDLKNMPPTLFLDGEKDGWKHASDMLFTKMHELGIQSEKWVAPDDGHNSPLTRPWLSQSLVKADQFLVELGLLEGEAIIEPLADKGIIFSQEP